jgi:hypothetical protein
MTKEEFISTHEGLRDQIDSIKESIEATKNHYIETNRKFQDGQKVKITTPDRNMYSFSDDDYSTHKGSVRFAYVSGYKVNYSSEVEILLKKAKKDGTMSKVNDGLWRDEVVTAAND